MMEVLQARPTFLTDRESMQLRYPQAYKDAVEVVAKSTSIPIHLFYGLIREESYFDAGIRSHSGAVGLTQLMPDTARDMANRMGLGVIDLRNPEENLLIGAVYLSYLYKQFGNWLDALLAYNSGLGRMRTWNRIYGELPGQLFLEAVPFLETREYGRKVLASAVAYGYLYYDQSPTETVRLLFPYAEMME